jgi:hypothetical protein
MSALHIKSHMLRHSMRTHGIERLLDGASDACCRAQDLELVAVVRDESDIFGGLVVGHCVASRVCGETGER